MKKDATGKTLTINLGLLFPKHRLFSDTDNDGYCEHINICLATGPGMRNGHIWAGLINLAVRINIETCGAGTPTPLTSAVSLPDMLLVYPPAKSYPLPACLEKSPQGGWTLKGHNPSIMERLLNCLAIEEIVSNEQVASRVFVTAEDHASCVILKDGIPPFIRDLLHFKNKRCSQTANPHSTIDLISPGSSLYSPSEINNRGKRLALDADLPELLSISCGRALFSLVSTASARATEVTLPLAIVGNSSPSGVCLKLEENEEKEAVLLNRDQHLLVRGGRCQLSRLLQELERIWFSTDGPEGKKVEAWKDALNNAALFVRGEGDEGRLAHRIARGEELGVVPKHHRTQVADVCRELGIPVPLAENSKPTLRRKSSWVNEETRLLQKAEKIQGGTGLLFCQVFMGGSVTRRNSFKKRFTEVLMRKGYQAEVSVIRSHKSAVSWLLEEIEPKLPGKVQRIDISIMPFKCPGQMELPTRWAQEIYPAPDILCKRRGWDLDKVQMSIQHNQQQAYQLRAFDGDNVLVCEASLDPPLSKVPYLLEGDTDQYAYPIAASLYVRKGEHIIFNEKIPTDREIFWKKFQQKWLPEMEAVMVSSLPALLTRNRLSFWEELRLEVGIDDDQEHLELAEERIAPMEALHEDIYFGLLAFCKAFCKRQGIKKDLHLGRIVPLMGSADSERSHAKLRIKPIRRFPAVSLSPSKIQSIGYSQGYLTVDFGVGPRELRTEEVTKLCLVAKAWGYSLTSRGKNIVFQMRPAQKPKQLFIDSVVELPNLEVIPKAKDVEIWCWNINGRPGIRVWCAGTSLLGRAILTVEATSTHSVHAQKARLLKPTLFINARHHANEISGTNACLQLLHDLTCDKDTSKILKDVNVVVVPIENADGVATFEEMWSETPNHKLHAARYNALGMEWYDQYFVPETPFGEARVKSRLYERWLPEYLIDLHGVPSHEWEQPFTGYLNSSFQEHWIPRSFVYAILPFYNSPEHPGFQETRELAQQLSGAMEKEKDIKELNKQVFSRYSRYAQKFEPELFNASMQGALVIEACNDRLKSTNFAEQNYPLVKSEVVTEVLDEVAGGPWLACCSRAHRVAIDTLLKRLAKSEKAKLQRKIEPEGVSFFWNKCGQS